MVEHFLSANVTQNFDSFRSVFTSFDKMKSDFHRTRDQTNLSREIIADLKEDQLNGMLRIYALQRMKVNTARTRERLQHLAVIKQTLPVL